MSGSEDAEIVDVQPAGGIQFPDDMVVVTSDRMTEPEPVAKPAEPAAKPEEVKTEAADKPAWVRWTEEGGMRVEPGKGASIDENGHIILDPEVAQRMATKRVMRVRDEERARGERLVREQRERADRLEADLRAAQTKPADPNSEKPWEAKGVAEPDQDDFDSIPEYIKAMLEWDRAQRGADTSSNNNDGAAPSEAPKRADFSSQAAHEDALAEHAFKEAYGEAMREAIEDGAALYEDFNDVAGPVVLPRTVLAAVLETDNVPEFLYHLGSHPEDVEKLQGLEGTRLTREIVKIEGRLEQSRSDGTTNTASNGTTVTDTNTATPKGPSHQPVPVIKPVRAGAAPRVNIIDAASQEDCSSFFGELKSRGL